MKRLRSAQHNKASRSGGSGVRANPLLQSTQRQSCASSHQVNKQQRSLQTKLATTRGNRPTMRAKKEKETDIFKARLQSEPQGPTAEPAQPQTHEPTGMHVYTTANTLGSLGAVIII